MENQNIYFKESLPKIPTKEEEKKLLEDIKNPRSKEKLVTKNLRLVVHICKKYQNTGILAEDLFVVGIIGLIKSVNTYVPEKKTRFVTYAAKCIENEILMCLRKEKKWTKLDSFQEIVYQNTSGKTLTIEETLYDESTNGNFEDKMERLDTISKTLTISLNELKSIEKQVLFLHLGGKKQKEIAAKIQKTQSYVSRILINVYNKNQQYSEMKIDEKSTYRYFLICRNEIYEFNILSEYLSNLQKEIHKVLKKNKILSTKTQKINENKYRVIRLSNDEESFLIIAEILLLLEKNN